MEFIDKLFVEMEYFVSLYKDNKFKQINFIKQ